VIVSLALIGFALQDFFVNMNVKGAQGDVINTVTVTSSTTDPGPTPNTASKTVTVQGGKP
jgi:hypothetical protein